MRNVEQIEYELTRLKGESIILVIPLSGTISVSIVGDLQVVEKEHRVGFHISTVMPMAIIFYAEDVESLENVASETITKCVRLLKRA